MTGVAMLAHFKELIIEMSMSKLSYGIARTGTQSHHKEEVYSSYV
jgi:hypothetical protein